MSNNPRNSRVTLDDPDDRYTLAMVAVLAITRLHRPFILKAIKAGTFPKPKYFKKACGRTEAYFMPDEINDWIGEQRAKFNYLTRKEALAKLDELNEMWPVMRKPVGKPGTDEHRDWRKQRDEINQWARDAGFNIDQYAYVWKFSPVLEMLYPGKLEN